MLARCLFRRLGTEQHCPAGRPSDPRGHFNLGMCLESQGERASALSCFRLAFDLQPTMTDAAANAAGLLIQEGKAEEASSLCYRVSTTG